MVKLPKKINGYKVSVDNHQKWYGTTDDVKKTVKINVKKSLKAGGVPELKDTIKHEKMHALYPKMSEKNVEKEHKSLSLRDEAIRGLI
jgi:hypothetical protein